MKYLFVILSVFGSFFCKGQEINQRRFELKKVDRGQNPYKEVMQTKQSIQTLLGKDICGYLPDSIRKFIYNTAYNYADKYLLRAFDILSGYRASYPNTISNEFFDLCFEHQKPFYLTYLSAFPKFSVVFNLTGHNYYLDAIEVNVLKVLNSMGSGEKYDDVLGDNVCTSDGNNPIVLILSDREGVYTTTLKPIIPIDKDYYNIHFTLLPASLRLNCNERKSFILRLTYVFRNKNNNKVVQKTSEPFVVAL